MPAADEGDTMLRGDAAEGIEREDGSGEELRVGLEGVVAVEEGEAFGVEGVAGAEDGGEEVEGGRGWG